MAATDSLILTVSVTSSKLLGGSIVRDRELLISEAMRDGSRKARQHGGGHVWPRA